MTLDTVAPAVTITSPTTNATYSTTTSTISLSGTASDSIGVTSVTWTSDKGGSGSATGSTNWSISGISLSSGNNIITVAAKDSAGNSATATITITYTSTTDSSLTASYNFDEGSGTTAKDTSGNDYNGTISGAAWTTGKVGGGALSFNGTSNYVAIPRMNYDEITVSVWFYRNSLDIINADAILGGWRWNSDTQLQEGLELRFPANSHILQFTIVTQNSIGTRTQKNASQNLVSSTGNWYHAAGTYNKTTGEQKLYVNGMLADTQTHAAGNTIVPLTYSAYPDMRVGHSRANNGYFSGKIDEMRVYSRVLDEEAITDIYNLANANTAPAVESLSAIGTTKNSSILNARINPNYLDTNVRMEYGTNKDSLSYTTESKSISGYRAKIISIPASSLSNNTTYYYRAAATNSQGTSYGKTLSFSTNHEGDNWKHFYNIAWDDTLANNVKYANQMGYGYVGVNSTAVSQDYCLDNPDCDGLKFYLINVHASNISNYKAAFYKSDVSAMDPKAKQFYQDYMAWKSNDAFPDNLAIGDTTSPEQLHPNWDFQQQKVIDHVVGKLVSLAHAFEDNSGSVSFKYKGIMFDIGGLSGEFYSWDNSRKKQRTNLYFWTGEDTSLIHPTTDDTGNLTAQNIIHEYNTYSDGRAAFYKQLKQRMEGEFPGAKWLIEPSTLYKENGTSDDYIYTIKSRSDKDEITPDMLFQEGANTLFVDDANNFNSGVGITKDRVGNTHHTDLSEFMNRLIAAKAGINGSWFNWYGSFVAEVGIIPNFQKITEVWPRLKFIRLIPNWDNLNRVLLSDRSWDGRVYNSYKDGRLQSYIDENLMYSRQPQTGKIFAVFNTHEGALKINSNETIISISKVDDYLIESGNAIDDFTISGNEIRLNASISIPEGTYSLASDTSQQATEPTGIGYIFTTATSSAPIVSTEGADKAVSTATLKANVSPKGSDTAWWFEYGTDAKALLTRTKEQRIAASAVASSVMADLSGLKAETTYYYRIGAKNEGGTNYGETLSFITQAKASGTEAYYAFDEESGFTAGDSSGSGNNGSIKGPSRITPGKIGRALSFDGSNDYIGFDTNLGITGELTISAWVYPEAAPSGTGRIIASTYDWDSVAGAIRGWTLGNESGSTDYIHFRVYDSSGNSAPAATVAASAFFANNLNKWVYVTGVYKPSSYIKLYVNGQMIAQTTISVPSAIAYKDGTNLRIGMRADSTSQGMWDGNIDEVRIYSKALTDADVQALYNTTTSGNLAPVITSALNAAGTTGSAFSYQIAAANTPTSFNAAGLPAGLSVSTGTGLIAGTLTTIGISSVTISAANAGGTGSGTLTLNVYSACDVNRDWATNVADVQLQVNAVLGVASCASDLNRDGVCDVIDVQRVVNAGLGGECSLGP